MSVEATPTSKDIAEFVRLMVHFGFLGPEDIVRWADWILVESDEPPTWAIDLSLTRGQEAVELLKRVDGDGHEGLAVQLLCAYLRRLWYEKKVDMMQLRRIGWDLHCQGLLPELDTGGDWGVSLEVLSEPLDALDVASWIVGEVKEFIREHLGVYAQYEQVLSLVLQSLGGPSGNDKASRAKA